MPRVLTSKITVRGQTTIPIEVRNLLDIEPGDEIMYIPHKNGFVIAKVTDNDKPCPCCKGTGIVKQKEGR